MKKVLVFIILVGFFVFSCEKSEEVSKIFNKQDVNVLIPSSAKKIGTKSSRVHYDNEFENFESYALELAISLKDKNMRKFLKDEASKKFDGDFSILVSNHLDKLHNLKNLVINIPNLNIGINELIEKWDINKNSILVATRVGLSNDSKALTAFDSKGERYEIDGEIEPDQPIIVIGYNERVEIEKNGKYKLKKININNEIKLDKKLKIQSCGFPYRFGAANYERLKGIKFNDLSVYEKWYDFAPEIQFRMYAPVAGNNYSAVNKIIDRFYTPSRSQVNNNWWNFSDPLFIWATPGYSTTMLYEFIEQDDNGTTQTFSIGLSSTYGIGSNNSSGTPNITGSVTPSIGYTLTKKQTDMVIGRSPFGMLDCPPNTDLSYQFNAGSSGFYFKAGY
jgi:hypothetical protein